MSRLRPSRILRFFALLILMTASLSVLQPKPAQAICFCSGCPPSDCPRIKRILEQHHARYEPLIMQFISQQFQIHRQWIYNELFTKHILPALTMFTHQLSAVSMNQMLAIGMFLDAENQLATQRLFQEMQTQIYRDYQPSRDFCQFGTAVRSLASTEQKQGLNAQAMNARQMSRHLGTGFAAGGLARNEDRRTRWENFRTTYCDPRDNNYDRLARNPNQTGLMLACDRTAPAQPHRVNSDIDYTRLVDAPRTLAVDFTDESGASTETERDLWALGSNLFGHDVISRAIKPERLGEKSMQELYMDLRSVVAKRNIAQQSLNALVAMKAAGTTAHGQSADQPQTWQFLGAILRELGLDEAEIRRLIGERPSYYAQLEILSKAIYQNPDFYAGLYENPENVKRRSVALLAIERMLDQAIYESHLRQEMATSVLLSSRLNKSTRAANRAFGGSQ